METTRGIAPNHNPVQAAATASADVEVFRVLIHADAKIFMLIEDTHAHNFPVNLAQGSVFCTNEEMKNGSINWLKEHCLPPSLSRLCIERQSKAEMEKYFKTNPKCIETERFNGRTPLHYFAEFGQDRDTFNWLERRSNTTGDKSKIYGSKCQKGRSVLHYAAMNINPAELIVENIVNSYPEATTIKDSSNFIPFHYSTAYQPIQVQNIMFRIHP